MEAFNHFKLACFMDHIHTHKKERKKHSLMLKVAKDEYSFQLIWIRLTGNRWVFISFHLSQTRTKMENIRNVSNSHMKHSFGIVQFHKVFNNFSWVWYKCQKSNKNEWAFSTVHTIWRGQKPQTSFICNWALCG